MKRRLGGDKMNTALEKSDDRNIIGCLPTWFCIRAQPKHEHVAAALLKKEPDIEVYLPRIRIRRTTKCGPKWFVEALFPNYLFARFPLATCLRKVHYTRGVRGVVHFGREWPVIGDSVIDNLRATVKPDEVYVISEELQPGDAVQISGGVFHDLRAVVTRVMPGRARVAVLLEFLGRQTVLELPGERILRDDGERKPIF
jgi:transcriptional antiterminator RfaH